MTIAFVIGFFIPLLFVAIIVPWIDSGQSPIRSVTIAVMFVINLIRMGLGHNVRNTYKARYRIREANYVDQMVQTKFDADRKKIAPVYEGRFVVEASIYNWAGRKQETLDSNIVDESDIPMAIKEVSESARGWVRDKIETDSVLSGKIPATTFEVVKRS